MGGNRNGGEGKTDGIPVLSREGHWEKPVHGLDRTGLLGPTAFFQHPNHFLLVPDEQSTLRPLLRCYELQVIHATGQRMEPSLAEQVGRVQEDT